ncbi:uncharacterized protein LOC121761406 [Salvia splendens]|uniref:uncharacterized protein LOC121761406 n=1 Tax=Salvia splendens TaxID=180675 RepID=UPI001C25A3AE|nr:uncharacterized protein LOC121761406 [Salvia splendens]
MATQLKSDALMEQMKLHMSTDAGKQLTKKIGLVYQSNIAPKKIGFNEKSFVVDLKKGEVKEDSCDEDKGQYQCSAEIYPRHFPQAIKDVSSYGIPVLQCHQHHSNHCVVSESSTIGISEIKHMFTHAIIYLSQLIFFTSLFSSTTLWFIRFDLYFPKS